MNGKNIALISYLPLIGWIIAFILYLENNVKDSIARFHLRQTLGLQILFFAVRSFWQFSGFIFFFSLLN